MNLKPNFSGLYRTFGNALVYMTDYMEENDLLRYKQLGFLLNKDFEPAIQLFFDKNGDTRDIPTSDYNLMKGLMGVDTEDLRSKVKMAKVEEAKQHVMSRMHTAS